MAHWRKWIAPVLAALMVGGYLLVTWHLAHSREVFVVNGLFRPYDVEINGQAVTLQPLAVQVVPVGEGPVTVRVTDPALGIEDQSCTIQTPFLSRPFLSRSFVINPDRLALIVWEEITYSQKPGKNDPYNFKYHTGKLLYEFQDIHFAFIPFPQEVMLDADTETRTGVYMVPDENPPINTINAAAAVFKKEALSDFYRRHLEHDPAQMLILYAYCGSIPPDDAIAYLQQGLDAMPPRVEWHRMYQTMVQHHHPGQDLEKDYLARLEHHPEDPTLLYLAGRVSERNAETYFQRAIQANPPSPQAYNALAWRRLCTARYGEALAFAQQARQLDPDNINFKVMEAESLAALKRFSDLLRINAENIRISPLSIDMRAQRIRYLVRSHREEEAREEIDRFCITLGSVADAQAVADSRKYLEGYLEYVAGRERAFLTIARTVPSLKLLAALTAGEIDEAQRLMEGLEEPTALDQLLLYIVASRAKRPEVAGASLDKAVALFAKGDAPSRRVAAILSSGSADVNELADLKLLPGEKRIVLVAIGLRIPAVRAQAFELAKNMNYSAMPPRLLLDKVFLGK